MSKATPISTEIASPPAFRKPPGLRISTEALEQGIVDKGLQCLYELNRYDTDVAFGKELDEKGVESLHRRRREIAEALEAAGMGMGGGPAAN